MDKSVFFSAFVTLFLAEMGDKTQFAVISMTGSTRKPAAVFLGAAAALTVVTAIGVFFGEAVTKFVPPALLRRGAAGLFMAMGAWMWFHPE